MEVIEVPTEVALVAKQVLPEPMLPEGAALLRCSPRRQIVGASIGGPAGAGDMALVDILPSLSLTLAAQRAKRKGFLPCSAHQG